MNMAYYIQSNINPVPRRYLRYYTKWKMDRIVDITVGKYGDSRIFQIVMRGVRTPPICGDSGYDPEKSPLTLLSGVEPIHDLFESGFGVFESFDTLFGQFTGFGDRRVDHISQLVDHRLGLSDDRSRLLMQL